ncbi:DALR domain-containing protein, partial [Streptococcus pyogenes]
YTEKAIQDAQTNLKYLKNTFNQLFTDQVEVGKWQELLSDFESAMDDDFNTANGITLVFDMAKWINSGNYNEQIKADF